MTGLIAEALSWVGTPYVHGASKKGAGCDCLGLMLGLWRHQIGPVPCDIPAYAPDWAETRGPDLIGALMPHFPVAQRLIPGTLLVFRMRERAAPKHLGILIRAGDDPAFVHSYSGRGVCVSRLTSPWARRLAARFDFPERSA